MKSSQQKRERYEEARRRLGFKPHLNKPQTNFYWNLIKEYKKRLTRDRHKRKTNLENATQKLAFPPPIET